MEKFKLILGILTATQVAPFLFIVIEFFTKAHSYKYAYYTGIEIDVILAFIIMFGFILNWCFKG